MVTDALTYLLRSQHRTLQAWSSAAVAAVSVKVVTDANLITLWRCITVSRHMVRCMLCRAAWQTAIRGIHTHRTAPRRCVFAAYLRRLPALIMLQVVVNPHMSALTDVMVVYPTHHDRIGLLACSSR